MLSNSLNLQQYFWGMLLENTELWLMLFPMMVIVELPLFLLVLTGIFRWSYSESDIETTEYPSISFVITCYGEGDAIEITIDTLVEQLYPGKIEVLAVVDGAAQNEDTYQAAIRGEQRHQSVKNRNVRVIPKWQRGGRVSTLNAGLDNATSDFVINVDGDTSFDNDMALQMMKQFTDKNVIASGGALRVRNWQDNLLTRMQSLEYMLSMQAGKTGLSNWGVLNNISGAFGAFRKNVLKQVGGWDTHTAEDLDLTMRLKQYKKRYPNNRLAFAPRAVGHTDVPHTLKGLVQQRLRWDGDLLFLFLRKHNEGLTPRLLGWGNFIFTLVYGVLQNVLLPILVSVFMFYIFWVHSIDFVAALMILIYCVYLFTVIIFFTVYIGLVSEREKEDLRMAKWLPLYPFYQFFMRLITAFSMVNELFRRSHEESSMAPWWVLKKGKKVLAMKVKFHLDKKNKPQSDDGVKVAYGQAKRGGYRFRWYLILSLVISPLVFVAYFFLKTNFLVIAPAIVTSYPVTLTAKVAGIVGPIPIDDGTQVERAQTAIQLTNLEIEAQIEFIHAELLGLKVNLPSDMEALHLNGIAETRRNLSKVQQIQKRYEEYRKKGQVSDVDYASIVGMGNSLNNQLNQQKLDYQSAKLAEEERELAGPVSQAKRSLMKDLALKRVREQELSVKSPYAGRVVDIHVVEGQRVFEGDELVTIAKNTVPHIVAYLDPKYLEDAVKGANALVKFPNGSSFEAEVSDSVEVVSKLPSQLVSPFEGQPAYLKVVLDFITAPPEEYWVEGMTVEARF